MDTLSDDVFEAALQRSASFWGHDLSSSEKIADFPLLTLERFSERMKEEPILIERRYAPSSFTFEEPLSLVPAYRRDVWPQLLRVIDETKARAIVTFVPAILQLDIPIFTTLQARGLPGASIASNNTPVAIEAIRQLSAEGVAATRESAVFLENAMMDPSAPTIQFWYIVVPVNAPLHRSSRAISYHDLQIMPGVSIASQCSTLAKTGEPLFHPSPDYAWETEQDELVVSSIDDRPAPLFRLKACRGSLTEKKCTCSARFLLTTYEK